MQFVALLITHMASTSIYGHIGTDEVVADVFDDIQVIETLPRPTNVKNIREAGYTDPIADNDYPWPGHSAAAGVTVAMLQTEYNRISSAFGGRMDMTQDQLYRHPAGARQYHGTQEEVDKADRVKAKYILDTRFGYWHWSGVYLPPGELITIEIPENAINKIWPIMNFHSRDTSERIQRLPRLRWENEGKKFNRKVNTFGWAYGGTLYFGCYPDAFPTPIEITISGAILSPWFKYGIDTDEDWDTKKKNPGLMAAIETGNIQMTMPSKFIRSSTRLNDACRFFRSCAQVMESTIQKSLPFNSVTRRPNGRERIPNHWWFETWVPAGAAVAFTPWDFSVYPTDWISNTVNVQTAMDGCWGMLHEMGHHHQAGWGIGYTGEVTNNVFCTLCYSYYTYISGWRIEGPNGCKLSKDTGWGWVTHPCLHLNSGDLLAQYVSMAHSFGQNKMREFMNADSRNLHYDRNKIGRLEAYCLRGAKIFGYDLRPHLKFFGWDIYNASVYNQTALGEIDAKRLKPWYPVTNLYATGYDVNGEVFETARPFQIPSGRVHRFDFMKYTVTRRGHGTFVLTDVKGRAGAWTKVSDGIYDYTPTSDVLALDEFRAFYHETTTDQTTVCYGRLQQVIPYGNTFARYNNIRGPTGTYPVLTAYNKTKGLTPDRTGSAKGLWIASEDGSQGGLGSYVTVCRGKFVAPSTGIYQFFAAPDDAALFYLSENPLTGDADLDSASLLLVDDHGYHSGYNKNWPSDSRNLIAGKAYFFIFVIYNHGGTGGGKIGFRVGTGAIKDTPNNQVIFEDVGQNDIDKMKNRVFRPEWEEIKGLDDNTSPTFIPVDRTNWTLVSVPKPEEKNRPPSNLIDGVMNSVYITKWKPTNQAVPFPHVFAIDFGMESEFNTVLLKSQVTGNYKGYVMESKIEVSCGTSSGSDKTLYSGDWDNRNQEQIKLSQKVKCNSLTVKVLENSYLWSSSPSNIIGGSYFSEISAGTTYEVGKIIPISSTKVKFTKSGWSDVRYGAYYNGLGKRGTTRGKMNAKFSGTNEIVIIGDQWSTETSGASLLSDEPDLASVYLDGAKIGEFTPRPTFDDQAKVKLNKRLYKQVLFTIHDLDQNAEHEVSIVVESGEIVLSGFLTRSGVKDVKAAAQPEEPPAPTLTPSPSPAETVYEPTKDESQGGKGKTGAIVGGIFGALIAVAVVVVVLIVLTKKGLIRRRHSSSDEVCAEVAQAKSFWEKGNDIRV